MAGAIKRPDGMSPPSGYVPDDPWHCDDCGRRIMTGRPFWGGGLDYFGEANDVNCERCAISWYVAVRRECDAYEREFGAAKAAS